MSRPRRRINLPTTAQLLSPLVAWARLKGKKNADIVRSKDKSRPGLVGTHLDLLNKAERDRDWDIDINLSWDQLSAVCEEWGFEDIGLLIHIAQADEMRDLHISHKHYRAFLYSENATHVGNQADQPIPTEEDAQNTGSAYRMSIPADWYDQDGVDLFGHRMVMEKVVLPKNKKTRIDQHLGSETVLMLEGSVEFHFNGGRSTILQTGDMFSFNSQQLHFAENNSDGKTAVMIVARVMLTEKYQVALNDLVAEDPRVKSADFMTADSRAMIKNKLI